MTVSDEAVQAAVDPAVDNWLDAGWSDRELRADVSVGLSSTPKELPPKWFYDDLGSELFDEITRLDEYYPTRREREILEREADAIAAASEADCIAELGSGTSTKTRILLDAFAAAGQLRRYVPFDNSAATLRAAAREVADAYPGLAVRGVVGDFEHHLGHLPLDDVDAPTGALPRAPAMVMLLGGTVGNFSPARRPAFLDAVAGAMQTGDTFLLGTDLVKDAGRLVAAYDDAAGVTARFNLNVLSVLNRRLGADFDLDAFAHEAVFDAGNEWIEMRLRSLRTQTVHIPALEMTVDFVAGERMRTEISAKFRPERVRAELGAAGLVVQRMWTDAEGDYALTLARRVRRT
ncbi:L-histidine N(alpha)-methyltransferase [Candidatus Poriferisodalis sp.]|uniref:L-histidine N(alpha)-methyltransferase n=1 Tax=Candidatus Poriferisodalis sp. TaxID=3101277 RepID=UPI0022A10657|nr:L-histidine N(alpha)-methyltransferase [Acidimicrobiaceae bacterium]